MRLKTKVIFWQDEPELSRGEDGLGIDWGPGWF